MTEKKLVKSESNRVIVGCLGGVAEYFGWEPTLVRIVFVLCSLLSAAFPGIIIYLILWILMPKGDRI